MALDRDYRRIFQRAGERWLNGDPGALDDFQRGIDLALEAGDVSAAQSLSSPGSRARSLRRF